MLCFLILRFAYLEKIQDEHDCLLEGKTIIFHHLNYSYVLQLTNLSNINVLNHGTCEVRIVLGVCTIAVHKTYVYNSESLKIHALWAVHTKDFLQ